jgi:hypothetical protein
VVLRVAILDHPLTRGDLVMKGRRLVAAALLTATFMLLPAGAALADECYVTKMSPTAIAKVSANSPNWFLGDVAELFTVIHLFGIPGVDTALTADQAAYASARVQAAGIPTQLAIFEKALIPKGKGISHERMTDGKGIDWFFHKYGEAIVGAYFDALANA